MTSFRTLAFVAVRTLNDLTHLQRQLYFPTLSCDPCTRTTGTVLKGERCWRGQPKHSRACSTTFGRWRASTRSGSRRWLTRTRPSPTVPRGIRRRADFFTHRTRSGTRPRRPVRAVRPDGALWAPEPLSRFIPSAPRTSPR